MSKVGKKRRWMLNNFEYLDNYDDANRILGFDLSLRSTGCVTYYRKNKKMEDNFLVQTTNEETMLDSVEHMQNLFSEIVIDFQPDIVAYESITAGGNFRSIKQLSMSYAMMLNAINKLSERPMLVSFGPTQLKKAACGNHQADKNQMLLGVYKKWEEEFEEDDIADAFVATKLAENLFGIKDNCLQQYENHVENGDMDTDKFLLEYDKGRIEHGCEHEKVFQVVKSTMKSKDFLKDQNDYELYKETRKGIRSQF